jgi:ribosomal protein S18 acetylase RimI-like enzyme
MSRSFGVSSLPVKGMHIDQIFYGLIEQRGPAKQLADLDKICFESDAMSFEEWLKVSNTFPIIVYAWQDDDKANPRGIAVVRYAAGISYLYSVAVIPEARRLGLGQRMLQKSLEIAKEKGCLEMQAHTRTENEASQKLLAKNGFKVIQYVPDFYDDCEDGILWSKLL